MLLVYLLGIKDGFLALWDTGSSTPLAVYTTKVAMLPAADQDALQQGIPIRDDMHLQQLLEDYLS